MRRRRSASRTNAAYRVSGVGGRECLLEAGLEVDRDHQPCEEAPIASAPASQPWEWPPRRSWGACDANAATTTSSISAASRCPPKVRYSFETPSRSTSRIRPQEIVLGLRHVAVVGEGPSLAAPILGHPVVDSLGIVVLERRSRPQGHKQECRAGAIGQIRVGNEAPMVDLAGQFVAVSPSAGSTAFCRVTPGLSRATRLPTGRLPARATA